jgi:hypothetical protein
MTPARMAGRQERIPRCPTFCSVGVGKPYRAVRHRSRAGPIFPSCPRASGVVQRLGYSRGGTALILDRLLRPDVSPGHRRKCECLRALPAADVCRWLLLLLSPLLSAAIPGTGGPT